MDKILEVKNLIVSFKTQGGTVKAVRDISFDLHKGETLAIVGESGSGKSVTSKAILGIQAGNSIVENGQILFDGKDLLRITEDDFHKIRGDKIAMIFQDPMSSLNPIMKIGNQLTEAMILKGKSSQKKSRKEFNNILKMLYDNIIKAENPDPEKAKYYKEQINIFDSFCIKSTQIEKVYNTAYEANVGLQLRVENLIFLLSKNQKVDIKKQVSAILKDLPHTLHKYVVVEDSQLSSIKEEFNKISLSKEKIKLEKEELVKFINLLKEFDTILLEAIKKDKPNYFTLGYYLYRNPLAEIDNMQVDDLNKLTREYLDEEFMNDFLKLALIAVKHSYTKSINLKKDIIKPINEALDYLNKTEALEKDVVNEHANKISNLVVSAINKLSVKKDSMEYSFSQAIKNAINAYFGAVKNNPIEKARYEKDVLKREKLIQEGKTPDWKIIPAKVVDLELCKNGIILVLNSMKNTIEKVINGEANFNYENSVVEIIDHLKDLASKVVYKVTKKIAKAKALKLLDEVGIPDANIRYKQYPFQFSGGMRQRVVIAIALAANPDILICDEPTTALDVTIQSQILELINKLKVERNLSIIFITHDLGVVANMADRIAVMYAGKIVEYGTSEDIFYDPRHPYTWALLGSMPDLHTKEKLESIPGTPPNMIYPPEGDAFALRNKYALEIDFEMQPPLFEVSETHYAATWLLHPNAPKVDLPKVIEQRIANFKKGVSKDGK